MPENIELGGNIELSGFNDIEPGMLIVVKKMVGLFTNKFSEKGEVKKVRVELAKEKDNYKISTEVTIGDDTKKAEKSGSNLFFVLDEALRSI